MKNRDSLIKILTIVGTGCAWFPILAPVLLSIGFFIAERRVLFDYLMPAELFPTALLGGGLLLWAAFRAHVHRLLLSSSLGIAVGMLVASQGLAVLTGLASGEHEAVGWRFAIVITALAIYILALVILGIGGILLLRNLFTITQQPTESF